MEKFFFFKYLFLPSQQTYKLYHFLHWSAFALIFGVISIYLRPCESKRDEVPDKKLHFHVLPSAC